MKAYCKAGPALPVAVIKQLHYKVSKMTAHDVSANIGQFSPSKTVIKAFTKSEVVELSLYSLHCLIAVSQAFFAFRQHFQSGEQPNISF
jgi:flagellar biosynthesis protein FlhB